MFATLIQQPSEIFVKFLSKSISRSMVLELMPRETSLVEATWLLDCKDFFSFVAFSGHGKVAKQHTSNPLWAFYSSAALAQAGRGFCFESLTWVLLNHSSSLTRLVSKKVQVTNLQKAMRRKKNWMNKLDSWTFEARERQWSWLHRRRYIRPSPRALYLALFHIFTIFALTKHRWPKKSVMSNDFS